MKLLVPVVTLIICLASIKSNAQLPSFKISDSVGYSTFIGLHAGMGLLKGAYVLIIGDSALSHKPSLPDGTIFIDSSFGYFTTPNGKVLKSFLIMNHVKFNVINDFYWEDSWEIAKAVRTFWTGDIDVWQRLRWNKTPKP